MCVCVHACVRACVCVSACACTHARHILMLYLIVTLHYQRCRDVSTTYQNNQKQLFAKNPTPNPHCRYLPSASAQPGRFHGWVTNSCRRLSANYVLTRSTHQSARARAPRRSARSSGARQTRWGRIDCARSVRARRAVHGATIARLTRTDHLHLSRR